jgi:chromate reductase
MDVEHMAATREVGMISGYRLLGLSGSLRTQAYSTAVMAALAAASAEKADYEYADIGTLPHFNQDLYVAPLPGAVQYFRDQIAAADGLVISSPEYNHGIPGVLKNALDWASRPHNGSPLRGKPVLIVTSSPAFTGGARAQYQIRETVISALARPVATPEIVVGGVNMKIIDGRLEDPSTIAFAMNGFAAMFAEIDRTRAHISPVDQPQERTCDVAH